jgi:tRNA pseudouridine55 synthase
VSVAGVLVLDKPAGVTSFDAVAAVRRRLGIRRVGHAGTLDPSATGVLPILVGEATKLMAYLTDQDKEYLATVRFGLTTDTHDLDGRVLATAPVPPLTRDVVDAACRPFVGLIRQVPPMYSAVHHEGRRLYELARAGVDVEREPREVVVHSIAVERIGEQSTVLRIVCGKGTYVRALAADLGAVLGCGAALETLVRTRVGPFTLEGALDGALLASLDAEQVWAALRPPESAISGWPAVTLDPERARRFGHGQPVDSAGRPLADGTLVRVHEAGGELLGVGEVQGTGTRVRPVRMLNADRSGTRLLPA